MDQYQLKMVKTTLTDDNNKPLFNLIHGGQLVVHHVAQSVAQNIVDCCDAHKDKVNQIREKYYKKLDKDIAALGLVLSNVLGKLASTEQRQEMITLLNQAGYYFDNGVMYKDRNKKQ